MEVVIDYEALKGSNNETIVRKSLWYLKVSFGHFISKPRTTCGLTVPQKWVQLG